MQSINYSDLHGRIGLFHLPRSNVKTPTLVPVIDPRNNIIPPKEIKEKFELDFFITSAYLYFKRFGPPKEDSEIHKVLDYEGNIMMDSGAYQILAYGDVDISPTQTLAIQSTLKTDVGVILDVPTPPTDSYSEAKTKVEETIQRIEESIEHIKNHPETIWTLPIQGGKNVDIIEYYINEVKKRDYLKYFNFYALGSVAPIMSQYDFKSLFMMIYTARKNLPYNIPLHLFGAGHPMIFSFIIALGCDTFDSAAYVLFAKENRYMTENGTLKLETMQEFPCCCEVCLRWSPKELQTQKESVRVKEIATHNLYMSMKELRTVKNAIRDGKLWELMEQRALSHPELYKGFIHAIENIDEEYWEKMTPISKASGLKIINEVSFHRPELTKARRKVRTTYQKNKLKVKILLLSGESNPIEYLSINETVKKEIANIKEEKDVLIFLPYIGLFPYELLETFPFGQTVFSGIITDALLEKSINEGAKLLNDQKYETIELENKDKHLMKDQEKKIIELFKEKVTEKKDSLWI